MFDFVFWKLPGKGLLIQCLRCSCTWGIAGYKQFLLIDESSDDSYVTECPICGERITASILKACIPEEVQ